jgi:uncharacterized protein YkwD
VDNRRPYPSALTLGLLFLAACLLPVLVAGVVGTDGGGDDVQAAGDAREAQATGFAGDSATGDDAGASAGDDDGERGGRDGRSGDATTTTAAAPETTAAPTTTEAPPEATTTAPPTTDPPATTPPTTAPPADASAADAVLALVNDARSAAGCDALAVDERLSAAALLHSQDMSARDYMDHVTPEGQDPSDRAQAQGYAGGGIGENVAQGYPSPEAVMDGWMNSEGHRANIENCDYTVIGVAVAPDGWYWTQMFGM